MEDTPRDEVAALHARIADLEAQLAIQADTAHQLSRELSIQHALLETLPVLVYVKDRHHRYLQVNRVYAETMGLQPADILHHTDAELYPPDEAQAYVADDEAVMAGGVAREAVEEPLPADEDGPRWAVSYKAPFFDGSTVAGMVGLSIDITARRRTELALQQSQADLEATITRQQLLLDTIHELSTPVIPIADRILVLPLIGAIDSSRSQQILESLLWHTQQSQADTIIIDITAVRVIDTAVANHLLQAARAVGLLGARCMLVGIAPEIAQTIVQLGIDLASIETAPSLQVGFARALARRGLLITQRTGGAV
ncbi:MAG TPA: PAS domain-containing protein [Roseiflexaceae bacterium]|nr:PAS domain-containing protein [Roseiflexaceae bacterium]HMP40964.1 PAS domain-containing protein [Roseiflexaceae bacterium]